MPRRLRQALTLPIAAVLLVGSCASNPPQQDPPPQDHLVLNPRECPNFKLDVTTFVITTNANVAVLGPGTLVRWDAGAVTAPKTYNVQPLVIAGKKYAGVSVTPADGIDTPFEQLVLLRLSFAQCPSNHRFVIAKREAATGSWRNKGGFQPPTQAFVEAPVDGFSDYAIAE